MTSYTAVRKFWRDAKAEICPDSLVFLKFEDCGSFGCMCVPGEEGFDILVSPSWLYDNSTCEARRMIVHELLHSVGFEHGPEMNAETYRILDRI